jgi:hypothetical protein
MYNKILLFPKSAAAHVRTGAAVCRHLNFRADTAAESFLEFQVRGTQQQKSHEKSSPSF